MIVQYNLIINKTSEGLLDSNNRSITTQSFSVSSHWCVGPFFSTWKHQAMGRCLDFGCGTGRGSILLAEGLVMPPNKNMKKTYQDKQIWHSIFSLKISEGWSNLVPFFWNNAGIMCWISPEAFSAKIMSGSHGVVKDGGAWMMLSQVIWTGVFHCSVD